MLTHKLTKTPEHRSWMSLRNRCNNPNNDAYSDYGGRGIAVCTEWDSFETFLKDMGNRPTLQHSIDRRNNDKGYSKSNCRWATKQEQANNRRRRSDASLGSVGIVLRPSGRFSATASVAKKKIWLGTYDTEEEAAKVRSNFLNGLIETEKK